MPDVVARQGTGLEQRRSSVHGCGPVAVNARRRAGGWCGGTGGRRGRRAASKGKAQDARQGQGRGRQG